MALLDQIKSDFATHSTDPVERVINSIKVALKFYPACKDLFKSDNLQTRKEGAEAALWLLNNIEKAVTNATKKIHLGLPDIMSLIYEEEKLTPIECQQYLQAQAWVSQNYQKLQAFNKEKIKQNSNFSQNKLSKQNKRFFINKVKI